MLMQGTNSAQQQQQQQQQRRKPSQAMTSIHSDYRNIAYQTDRRSHLGIVGVRLTCI